MTPAVAAPGSAPMIAEAIRGLGHHPADVRRLVLTHGHVDHVGAAAEIASWGEVAVLAHHADAPVIRGEAVAPPPNLADWVKRLALLDAGIACFGHGEPITQDAAARMQATAEHLP
jgi:glyoxylase-like metal-dependent hydrolase (beta-lactamase superfamily II)